MKVGVELHVSTKQNVDARPTSFPGPWEQGWCSTQFATSDLPLFTSNMIGWRQTPTISPPNHIHFSLFSAKKIAKSKTGLMRDFGE
jgi:hypothetical protein